MRDWVQADMLGRIHERRETYSRRFSAVRENLKRKFDSPPEQFEALEDLLRKKCGLRTYPLQRDCAFECL